MNKKSSYIFVLVLILLGSCAVQKNQHSTSVVLETNVGVNGTKLEIEVHKGREHNHPTFAIWTEDLEGNFLETLFVTKYIASGVFGFGQIEPGKWDNKPGTVKRPATLPYWLHKKGLMASGEILPTPKNPIVDAITAATPKTDFTLRTTATKPLPNKFRLLLEINQPWDSNAYWSNTKFQDNNDYKASCQPALVYAVTIDLEKPETEYYLNPIGHSNYAGENGELYTNLTTFTTALDIVELVVARLK